MQEELVARFLTALALAMAVPAFAADAPVPNRPRTVKAAWEWSDDERIEQRLNAENIRERSRIWRAENYSENPQSMGQMFGFGPPSPFIVDGSRNPELIMPSELFLSLIMTPEDELQRKPINEQLKIFGWDPPTFWKALKEASADFWTLSEESIELQRSLSKLSPLEAREVRRKVDSLEAPQCLARFNALQQLRKRYPGDFDRFLYTAVAPNIRLSSTMPTASESFQLRYIEGGCR
jgi:hypothetical protein